MENPTLYMGQRSKFLMVKCPTPYKGLQGRQSNQSTNNIIQDPTLYMGQHTERMKSIKLFSDYSTDPTHEWVSKNKEKL